MLAYSLFNNNLNMNRYLTSLRDSLVVCVAIMPLALFAGHADLEFPNEETLACNNLVHVSVNATCGVELSPDDMLEGEYPPSTYSLEIFSSPGVAIDQSDVRKYLNRQLVYHVTDVSTGLYCWGYIHLEDKSVPLIDCDTCTDPDVTDPDCIFNCAELALFTHINPLTGERGYDKDLLDQLIPSEAADFISNYVTDNCNAEVSAFYIDGNTAPNCTDGADFTRKWIVEYERPDGTIGQEECLRYYRFAPLSIFDDMGDPIIIEGDGTPVEDVILMPQQNVTVPICDGGYTPAEIAAAFDDPTTTDSDSDDNGLDPDEFDVDCVIENNEGIWRAYPHYYLNGIKPSGLHAQPIDNTICTVNADYTDVVFDACGEDCAGNFKVSRTWTIVDWCKGTLIKYIQTIDAKDTEGPEIDVEDFTASVTPWECSADVLVPQPEHIYDNCDRNATYTVQLPGHLNDIEGNAEDGYVIKGVNQGLYDLNYLAEDCCGNITKVTVALQVVDHTPPVTVVKKNLVVDMSPTGIVNEPDRGVAKVYASDIDNGSYDSCTDVDVYVRRLYSCGPQDTVWGPHVTFCCNDLAGGNSTEIDIEFKAVDWHGNENFAWSTIRLEDKGGLQVCPPDMVLDCDVDYWDYRITGIPSSQTSCLDLGLVIDTVATNENTGPRRKRAADGNVPGYIGVDVPAYDPQCGFGAIRREWQSDGRTVCTQWYVLEPIGDVFDPSTIVFPDDVNVVCAEFEVGEPSWLAPKCNLISQSVESDTLRFEGDACIKILNFWTVINWCIYDPLDSDLNHLDEPTDTGEVEGRYDHLQIIKVEDKTFPTVLTVDNKVYGVNENCESKGIVLSAAGLDEGDCPSPLLGWHVRVDLYDDWDIEYEYRTGVSATLNGEPNPFYLPKTSNGEIFEITIPDGVPASKRQHRVDWIVLDGCRNETIHSAYFTIEDTKAPTPYCLNLGTTVMENGEVELWAIDFNVGSFDHCTSEEDVYFTFTDVPPPPLCHAEYDGTSDLMWYDGSYWFFDSEAIDSTGDNDCVVAGYGEYSDGGYDRNTGQFTEYGSVIHRWEPSARTSGRKFTTSDVGVDGHLQIPIYAWDECGNRDFCLVVLRVIDNDGGTSGMIAGVVMTEDGRTVENVQTELRSDLPGYPKSVQTDQAGTYAFDENILLHDYEVIATKDDDYLNGVSTIDIVMMQRHILGLERIESPYKMIAADINNDQRINGQDLVELRKLILGVYTELPQNDSWMILDARSQMDMDDPWQYDEDIHILDMQDNLMDQDFTAVKIGDLDDSALTNGIHSGSETGKVTNLSMTDELLSEGEETEISFSVEGNVVGYQLSLEVKDMDILEVQGAGIQNQNIRVHDDILSISVEDASTASGTLFTIRVLPQETGATTEMIKLLTERISPEVYAEDGLEVMALRLNNDSSSGFRLSQNEPNPFGSMTSISYSIPERGVVELSLYDVTGRLLQQITTTGQQGENTIQVDATDLEPGVIYYQLSYNGNYAVKKMVLLEE